MRTTLTILAAVVLAACSTGEVDPAGGEDTTGADSLISGSFDRNVILTDAEMLDTGAMTAAQMDAFLARPYPQYDDEPSCLAKVSYGGKSVGKILVEKAQKYGISPLFLVAHLQKESSLVGEVGTCPADLMEQAFGCGCPDGGTCAPQYAGFVNQTECAAKLTRSYLDDLATQGSTISGWAVGKAKKTLDPQTITPKNKAAAVLYTYTPWVGDKTAGGNKAPFGNYLFWKNYTQYAKTVGYKGPKSPGPGPAPECTSNTQCNGGKSGTGRVCGTIGATKGTCIDGCHGDSDCASGQACIMSGPAWTCQAVDPSKPRPVGASCSATSQCNGGKDGTERVCSANNQTCVIGCHADKDCGGGKVCDVAGKGGTYKCVADAPEPAGGDLNVPFECQNTNGTGLGGSTCQITSAAMVLRYWGAKGKGSGKNTKALDILNKYGDYNFAKSPAGVASIFEDFGLYARWTVKGTIAQMKAHLDAGRPLVVNGFFTEGHVVVFTGYDATGFFVNDPNGDWNGTPYVGGSVSYAGTTCPGTSGKSIHMSYKLIESSNVICTKPGPCYEGDSGVWFAVAGDKPF